MIRPARVDDLADILALGYEALALTPYRHVSVNEPLARKVLLYHISSPRQFAWVKEHDGVVRGVLIGACEAPWFSTRKVVTDLLFYVRPEARGAGAWLARRYLRWARSISDCDLYGLDISSGLDIERTGALATALGLSLAGGIYLGTPA